MNEIKQITDALDNTRIESIIDLVSLYELKSMVATAELIGLAPWQERRVKGLISDRIFRIPGMMTSRVISFTKRKMTKSMFNIDRLAIEYILLKIEYLGN